MLHAVDATTRAGIDDAPIAARRRWLALLARSDAATIAQALAEWPAPAIEWLRRPEVGLAMVRGRTGGSGAVFNLGELTVTRCALRLPGLAVPTPVGVGWVKGRHPDLAEQVALADAMLQCADRAPRLIATLVEPLARAQAAREGARDRDAQSTRVEFFTVARES